LLLGLASAVILESESSEVHDPVLLSQIPRTYTTENRADQLYPQALGYHFVASYDSQGYGGGILTRLHTGLTFFNGSWSSSYNFDMDGTENIVSNSSSIAACVFVAAFT
jgi:hypothetical protein